MPAYAYKAVHATGRMARGEMTASSEHELAHHLSESGLELITAKPTRHAASAPIYRRGVAPRVLAGFCARMHDLLRSGISFAEALNEVIATTDNRILAAALAQITRSISNGSGIAASFAACPKLFPPIFIAIIGAGERSGNMVAIFDFLARYAENAAVTQEKLRKSLRYPLFLFFIAGGAVLFMMVAVVPQLVEFLSGLQSKLPLSTRILVIVSSIVTNHLAALGLTVTALIAGIFAAYRLSLAFALGCDALILRMPVIGNVVRKNSLARFTRGFAILFRSGCAMQECLRQAGDSVSNRALRGGIEETERRVAQGASLSRALEGIMPAFALGLLRTGERSGDLAKSLDDITATYDREAQAAMDHFIGLLEPCLTLVIGGILAWTVLAIMGPLYGSLGVLEARM